MTLARGGNLHLSCYVGEGLQPEWQTITTFHEQGFRSILIWEGKQDRWWCRVVGDWQRNWFIGGYKNPLHLILLTLLRSGCSPGKLVKSTWTHRVSWWKLKKTQDLKHNVWKTQRMVDQHVNIVRNLKRNKVETDH